MKTIEDAGGRYELTIDGARVGVATYRDVGDRRVFLHTEIDPDFAGRGLATELVEWALGDVRGKGKRIVAKCPMVAAYLSKHHQFDDILDTPKGVEGP
ncbi:MAG TPA: GNAT family N-acetyltransferase [Microbacteriaceae bacterium]|jgi:predicted GNAT family acetyltransferase|nr:GNAT family N-acetyltransferase [Microbacteriaceae bacterium]